MTDQCFLCQEKCSRKVCFQCSCVAHPKCWKNFQTKSFNSCPVCRSTNIVKPYKTRSTSFYDESIVDILILELGDELLPRENLIYKIKNLLNEITNLSSNISLKIKKFEKIMYLLLAGVRYSPLTNILLNKNFSYTVKNKLVESRRVWSKSIFWQQLLFD